MSIKHFLILLLISLVIINFITEGAVFVNAQNLAQEQTGSSVTQLFSCAIGNMIIQPVVNYYGFAIPIPMIDDLIIIITLLILSSIILDKINKEIENKILFYLILSILYWVILKIIGFLFLQYAGQGCIKVIEATGSILLPLFFILGILALPKLIALIVWWLKSKK